MNHVYFIIVNYNNSDVTLDCVKSINELVTVDISAIVKCIIVDNGSVKKEREKLKVICDPKKKLNLQINIIFSENYGYFPAFNCALNTIENKKGISVVLCNNDLVFDRKFLLNYYREEYNDRVLVVSPDIINMIGNHQNPHLITRFSKIRIIYYYLYYSSYFMAIMLEYVASILNLRSSKMNKKGFDKSQYITMGFGACYVLTPFFFNYFSSLDDYTFLMGEEGVLANQVLKVGGRTYYDSSLKVCHLDSSTFKKIASKSVYNYSRDAFWISRKHYKLEDLYDSNE